MNNADRYQILKAQEALLKEQLAEAAAALHADFDAGKRAITSDGTEYVRSEVTRREYSVAGRGGMLALLRRHTELDASKLFTVKAAEAKKLPKELLEALRFVDRKSFRITESR